jgi:signal transduction histidine kinase
MAPYRGRLALRVARFALSLAGLIWYLATAGVREPIALGFLAYAIFAAGAFFEGSFDSGRRALIALAIDFVFFAGCRWLLPDAWIAPLAYAYVLISAIVLHPLWSVIAAAAAGFGFIALLTPIGNGMIWTGLGSSAMAVSFALYRRALESRISKTLRHNVLIRSQAEGAREAERERIAADFHDGPLQNFISFQMRLEILRKLLARDVEAAAEELRQLQELCRKQVTELRSFVRSMRPVEEGVSLSASLSRMVEQFQRDAGVQGSFSSAEFHDPPETEVSLELLQIVREALNNIHKHSGASRVAVMVAKRGGKLEVRIEDNGSGFPFSGTFSLEELELARMGPVSIKRRVRLLGGELKIDSRPGSGAALEIQVPL